MKKIAKKSSGDWAKKEKISSDSAIIREIDNLARITASGFDGVNKKFSDVNKRFDEVDKKFYEVNERLGRIETALFWDYKSRIEHLEDQVKELQSDYRQLIGVKK